MVAQLEVKLVASSAQAEVQVIASDDLVSWALGTDKDIVFFPRTTSLSANTALAVGGDDVLVGTPVSPAMAADSAIISNITASGDILLAVNKAGNSIGMVFLDGSTGDLSLRAASGASVDIYIAGTKEIDYATGAMAFQQATTISTTANALTLNPAGDLILNDAKNFINDTANGAMTVGLTILSTNGDEIISLKNGDVDHGAIGVFNTTETDTWGNIRILANGIGGLELTSLAEDTGSLTTILQFTGIGARAQTTKDTNGVGLVNFMLMQHNSTGTIANITANGNVFSIRARVGGAFATRFMVDAEGDIFVITGALVDVEGTGNAVAATAFDGEDDLSLLRAFELSRQAKGFIHSEFDKIVRDNEERLIELGILGAPVDEGGMWNLTQHTRLLTGGVWQLMEDMMSIVQLFTQEQRSKLTPRLQNRLALMEAN